MNTQAASLDVTFYGVRGSTPCSCESNQRYGGNTSCVVVDLPDSDPIIFDLGTGLRYYGQQLADSRRPFHGTALVSHLHWDHVQGLPFFAPINQVGARLEVYGPPEDGCSLEAAFDQFMAPPFFPIGFRDLAGDIIFHDVNEASFAVGAAMVTALPVPHIGATNGYRLEVASASAPTGSLSVVYISDHQQPRNDGQSVDPAVLALAAGADLLIHDAQFTPEEFADRTHWGHCTVDYALEVAHQAGVKELVLFHHDPAHDDEKIDAMLIDAQKKAESLNIEKVSAAWESRVSSFPLEAPDSIIKEATALSAN